MNLHLLIITDGRNGYFGGAIQAGWSKVPAAATHVLHLEDDFLFETAVDVEWMAATLDANPHLAQLVLKRQAWNDEEKEAGGIVECWPDLYEEVEASGGWYTQHRLYFSTNPCMYRRELTERGWPDGPHSERTFTDQLLEDPATRFAFVGGKFDPRTEQEWATSADPGCDDGERRG
jgi:hypothetical protein